jgi:hypothetical protein
VSPAVNDPEPREEPEKVMLVFPVINAMSNLLELVTFTFVSAAVNFPDMFEDPEISIVVFPAVMSILSLLDECKSISRLLLELNPIALPSQESEAASLFNWGMVTVILGFADKNGIYFMVTIKLSPDWRISMRSSSFCGADMTTL